MFIEMTEVKTREAGGRRGCSEFWSDYSEKEFEFETDCEIVGIKICLAGYKLRTIQNINKQSKTEPTHFNNIF